MNDEQRPTLEQVKAAIERLEHVDRAMLRLWELARYLARYDGQGQREHGYASRPKESEATEL